MAWKELLRLHDAQQENQTGAGNETQQNRDSLIGRLCEGYRNPDRAASAPAAEKAEQEPIRYPDGYVRRSPLQPYTRTEEYRQRRYRRNLLALLCVLFAVLLVYALMQSGLLVFRLR